MKNVDKWQGRQFLYGKIVVFLVYEVLSEVSLERDRNSVAGNMDGPQEVEGRLISNPWQDSALLFSCPLSSPSSSSSTPFPLLFLL